MRTISKTVIITAHIAFLMLYPLFSVNAVEKNIVPPNFFSDWSPGISGGVPFGSGHETRVMVLPAKARYDSEFKI